MNDKERENLARIRRGVYIYDCYDKPVTTIAGAFNDNPDRSIVMVVDPTHPQTDTPFREILVLDPQMAVRLALRLMNLKISRSPEFSPYGC